MLWDPIRKQWVAKTPEEEVRQKLIKKMIEELGYPKGLISVEKGLGGRRFDLVCYAPKTLKPLLLVECKAGKLGHEAENQVLGYNYKIGAPFVCLVNGQEIKTVWREKDKVMTVPFLPPFSQLVAALC